MAEFIGQLTYDCNIWFAWRYIYVIDDKEKIIMKSHVLHVLKVSQSAGISIPAAPEKGYVNSCVSALPSGRF